MIKISQQRTNCSETEKANTQKSRMVAFRWLEKYQLTFRLKIKSSINQMSSESKKMKMP